ncbi:TolC family protein [Parasulfuritortus cantonensis]|uniref:TolC family protein n=1 Tax=Parasulfuritortus cantonensis TaxID=2528202 RepID=A0A4R1BFC2_9PROT|nr:TolC family protein [Parasulfuritortus cantonensis]TCJ15823.1 TolC family protein [Parasulfuritortus cantonensis]
MTMNKRFAACLLGAALAALYGPAGAEPGQAVPPADLPPLAAVDQVLTDQPMVRAAQAGLRAAEAQHRVLQAGEHEFSLGLTGQQRRVSGASNYSEWNVSLQRGLRLPGKAALDDRIGRQGVLAAGERIGDARHESGRQLLTLWYGARLAGLETRLWQRQAELLQADLAVVQTRVRLGDAARLDSLQAEAALAQARSQAVAAEAREQAALAELSARFPGLPAPDASAAEPVTPAGDAAAWLAHTLEHNHEMLAAQRALDQAGLMARRAEANRVPDPTVGLHVANEQGGNDRIFGVSLNLALPGENRRAQAQAMAAQADVLAEAVAATRRRLAAESAANWQRAVAGVASWRRLADAAEAVGRHADLARRAHELGELGLSETLLAQRNALDAQLAAGQARLAANEAVARLMLDAHQLWPLGGEHEEGEDHPAP